MSCALIDYAESDEIDDLGELFDALGVLLVGEFQSRQHRYVSDLIFV